MVLLALISLLSFLSTLFCLLSPSSLVLFSFFSLSSLPLSTFLLRILFFAFLSVLLPSFNSSLLLSAHAL